jgi:ankyrin repeat domain-containing protein 50
LQVAQLLSLERERDIRDRLGKLPKDLKDAYDEIYAAIRKADGSKPETAVRAFQWAMCSCEPLPAEELVAAVCQDPEEDGTQAIDIDIHFVLDACSNLLVVDPQLGVCRFSHLSVQEYFENHWDTNQTNGTVAKVCLSLLNDPDNWERSINSDQASQNPKTNQVDPLAKLLDYARRFWPTHVQNHGETNIDNRLSTLLKKFLGSMNESGPAYRSWYKMYTKLGLDLRRNTLLRVYDLVDPSYFASLGICLFGFNNVLAKWWEARSIDPEQRNRKGYSLLVLAVFGSSSNVVKALVKSGADVNAQLSDGDYGSALAAAVAKGKQDMVRLLLESGADVNARLSGSRAVAARWQPRPRGIIRISYRFYWSMGSFKRRPPSNPPA